MNKIDTTQASDPGKRQPWSVRSLQFIQDAYKEALAGLAQSAIGDNYATTIGYGLYGCKRASSISPTVVAGFVYFNGEIYYFPGISGYTGFSNAGVFTLVQTNGTPDPITFTDSTQGNVHNVRRVTLVDQANGTGLFNFDSVIYVNDAPTAITVGVGTGPAFGSGWANQVAVKFRIDHNKLVHIQGVARKSTGSTSGAIFTLPSGYRPVTSARTCNGLVLYDTITLSPDFINIATNGNVSVSGFNNPVSFSTGDVYFDISFYAD